MESGWFAAGRLKVWPRFTINRILGIQGGVTVNPPHELKVWTPDPEEGGCSKDYLDAATCRELARAFAAMADQLDGGQ